jgi:hypothetical protein
MFFSNPADNRYGEVCHAPAWSPAIPAFPPLGLARHVLLFLPSIPRAIDRFLEFGTPNL